MTCRAKQQCFSRQEEGSEENGSADNVNADTTFRIFDRVMHLDPKDPAHPTIVCPRRSIKIDVLIQECKACEDSGNVNCKQTNYSDAPNWYFHTMYNSSWSGYQRAKISNCDELAAALDSEQCSWDDSWLVDCASFHFLKRLLSTHNE